MPRQVVAGNDSKRAPPLESLALEDVIIAEVGDNIAKNTLNKSRKREVGGTASTASNASTSMSKGRSISEVERVALSCMRELRDAAIAAKPPPAVTIKETVKLISSIEEIYSDLDLYFFTLNFIRDKTSREIFMSLPPDSRVWWIRTSYNNRL